MLKKTITYEDFNGEQVTEDFFFHLSKAELVELEVSHKDGLSEALQRIVTSEDGAALIAEFKKIILGAYGKRSEDGKRFIKNQQIREEFESSEAYSVFFIDLLMDTDAQIEFMNGIIPPGIDELAAKVAAMNTRSAAKESVTVLPRPELAVEPKPVVIITRAELAEMPAEELAALGERLISGEAKIAE